MAKILIAEDDQDIRELVTITLQFNGHEVVSAVDGAQAVEKAESESFDLILMDVRMPRMTGYEACRLLREMESTREIPIIFLSAKGQEAEIQAGLQAGATQYILKPFAPDVLANRIESVLAETG
ncbi:MAG: response regulator transcription factor [Chloroflexota bacterium]